MEAEAERDGERIGDDACLSRSADSGRKERMTRRRESHFAWLRQQKDVFLVRSFPDNLAVLEALMADVESYTRNEREERCKERDAVLKDVAQLKKDGDISEAEASKEQEELERSWTELDSAKQQYERTLRRVLLVCREMQSETVRRGVDRLVRWIEKEREKMGATLRDLPSDKEALQELLDADDKRISKMSARTEDKQKLEKDAHPMAVVKETLKTAVDKLAAEWPMLEEVHERYRSELQKALEESKQEAWRQWQTDRNDLLSWINDQTQRSSLKDSNPLPSNSDELELLKSNLKTDRITKVRHQLDLDNLLAQLHGLAKTKTISDEKASAEEQALLQRWKQMEAAILRYEDELTRAGTEQHPQISEKLLEQVEQLSSWCRSKRQTFRADRQLFPQYLSALEELADCFSQDYVRKEYSGWLSVKVKIEKELAAKAKLNSSAKPLLDQITADWEALKTDEEAYTAALDMAIEARQAEVADEAETNHLLSWAWQRRAELSQRQADMHNHDVFALSEMAEKAKQSSHDDVMVDIMRRKQVLESRLASRVSTLSRACAENVQSAFWSLETATDSYIKALESQIRQKNRQGKSTDVRVTDILEWVKAKNEWLQSYDLAEMDHAELKKLAADFGYFQQNEWAEQRQEKRLVIALLAPTGKGEGLSGTAVNGENPTQRIDRGKAAGQVQSAWSQIRREINKFSQELEAALASSADKCNEEGRDREKTKPATTLAVNMPARVPLSVAHNAPAETFAEQPVDRTSPELLPKAFSRDQYWKCKDIIQTEFASPTTSLGVTAVVDRPVTANTAATGLIASSVHLSERVDGLGDLKEVTGKEAELLSTQEAEQAKKEQPGLATSSHPARDSALLTDSSSNGTVEGGGPFGGRVSFAKDQCPNHEDVTQTELTSLAGSLSVMAVGDRQMAPPTAAGLIVSSSKPECVGGLGDLKEESVEQAFVLSTQAAHQAVKEQPGGADSSHPTVDSALVTDTSSGGIIEVDGPIGGRLSSRDRMLLFMEHQAELLAWIRRQLALFQQRDFPSSLPALDQLRQSVEVFERGAMASKSAEKNAVLEAGRAFVDEEGDDSDDAKVVAGGNSELIAMWEWLEKEMGLYKDALRDMLQQSVVPSPPPSPCASEGYARMSILLQSTRRSKRPPRPSDASISNVTAQDLICSLWDNYNHILVPF